MSGRKPLSEAGWHANASPLYLGPSDWLAQWHDIWDLQENLEKGNVFPLPDLLVVHWARKVVDDAEVGEHGAGLERPQGGGWNDSGE
jgi:hypothetical protein